MQPPISDATYPGIIYTLKTPLTIIRSNSEHLLEVYDRLSDRQKLILLKAIQSQTILLEYLLDELAGQLALLDKKATLDTEVNE